MVACYAKKCKTHSGVKGVLLSELPEIDRWPSTVQPGLQVIRCECVL